MIAGLNKKINLYDLKSGTMLNTFKSNSEILDSKFVNDEQHLLSATKDGYINKIN